ncbi:MAG: hypothetical protein IT422_23090 [Pirellulaceae bacterium]|jgi:hypothetical protein|nr:hypothetical protein [Pirellulaceae bacterium]
MHTPNRVKTNGKQTAGPPRRGGLIVCVLILLLIIGLMMSQTVQTLMLVRRGDTMRQRLRQTRELVELGELVLQQQPAAELPNTPLLVSLAEPTGKPSNATAETASIAFTPVDSSDTSHSSVRIAVTYPLGSSREFTATQTVIRQESIDDEKHP